MKIIITGGCGFIGGNLVRKLISDNSFSIFNIDKLGYASDQYAIDRILKEKKNNKYSFYKLNLLEKDKLCDLVNEIEPDIIMHLAAESHVDRSIQSPKDFIESNIVGTFNLLEATKHYLRKRKINSESRFIFHHISTDEVFGSLGKDGKFNEDTAYDPRSPYSASKASSDHLVRAYYHTYNLPCLITNCSNNFGPWQFPEKLIPLVITKALNNEQIPIYGDGSNVRDWLYVQDHVDALLLCALKGTPGETYCIGGYGEQTNKYIVERICEILDKEKSLSNFHSKLITFVKDRPGHDQRYAIDSTKITNKLGWIPKYGFEKGLETTVKWYLNNYEWCKKILEKSNYNCERIGL